MIHLISSAGIQTHDLSKLLDRPGLPHFQQICNVSVLQTFSKTLPEKKKLAQQTFFKIESTKNSSEKNFLKSKTLLVTVLKLG